MKERKYLQLLLASLGVGFLLRLFFVYRMPVVNDEAFYIYDGYNINAGLFPFRDFFTRSLPFIYLLSFWQMIFGEDLILNRFFMLLINFIAGFLIYAIVAKFDRKIAYISSIVYFLDSFVASRSILVMTNPFFIALYLLATYIFVEAKLKKNKSLALLTGIVAIFAYLTRQTGIFLWPLFFLLLIPKGAIKSSSFRKLLIQNIRLFLPAVLAFFISIILVFGFVYINLGLIKAKHVLGLHIFRFTSDLSKDQPFFDIVRQRLNYPINVIADLSLSNPLVFAGYMISLVIALRSTLLKRANGVIIAIFYLYLIFLLAPRFGLFMNKYYGSSPTNIYYQLSYHIFLFIVFVYSIYTASKDRIKKHLGSRVTYLNIITHVGLILLLAVYTVNRKFDYLIELYPLLVIQTGISIFFISRIYRFKKFAKILLPTLTIFFLGFSFFYNSRYVFIGSHKIQELYQSSKAIERMSTKDDLVFTGFPLFALLADREVPMNISHPSWFGYAFISDEYRDEFLPRINVYIRTLRDNPPKFAVVDRFTTNSYLARYGDIREFISKNYEVYEEQTSFTVLIHRE